MFRDINLHYSNHHSQDQLNSTVNLGRIMLSNKEQCNQANSFSRTNLSISSLLMQTSNSSLRLYHNIHCTIRCLKDNRRTHRRLYHISSKQVNGHSPHSLLSHFRNNNQARHSRMADKSPFKHSIMHRIL
jgi:hypothetical protein